jgi:hypothetical protein
MIDDAAMRAWCDYHPVILAEQEEAFVVRAMAAQAIDDGDCLGEMLAAGCNKHECRAAFSDGKVVN